MCVCQEGAFTGGLPTPSDVRAFSKAAGLGLPIGRDAVLCLAERALPLARNVSILPIGAL
ncbi:MAG: hypothetical protein IKQ55_09405 [Kiritimatiellae bacterium]|nr:hypothetical protein [Kiritimatiellia bacterium]